MGFGGPQFGPDLRGTHDSDYAKIRLHTIFYFNTNFLKIQIIFFKSCFHAVTKINGGL